MTTEEAEWFWQGFFGQMPDAIAAKIQTDESALAGAWLPQRGEPPLPADQAAQWGMFGVMVRKDAPMTAPANMIEANAALVGRMVGG